MPDEIKNQGQRDRAQVNIDSEREMRYWMKELAVSEAKLKEIVGKVGPSVDKVRRAAQSM